MKASTLSFMPYFQTGLPVGSLDFTPGCADFLGDGIRQRHVVQRLRGLRAILEGPIEELQHGSALVRLVLRFLN
jgi:hypothetical protein